MPGPPIPRPYPIGSIFRKATSGKFGSINYWTETQSPVDREFIPSCLYHVLVTDGRSFG